MASTPNRLRDLGTLTAGTSEVQTLTIGGTPTGGTFILRFEGNNTSAITWSATNNTLLANIQAALDAHPSLGTNGCVASAGTVTAGIGTVLLTFGAIRAKENVELMTVFKNSLTGTAPTLAIATTTPGVNASGRYAQPKEMGVDSAGTVYVNTATSGPVATWTVVGSQT
ncbi:MAG TPA: hypothetical protein VL866_24065 [Pyrinomonadaceae bacterium]|nr:hypothetical protein [Pyrinomonadaceae bacterium]